jgi:lipopolysaccharide export system permease protein
MNLLDRYAIRTILASVALVMSVLLVLSSLFMFIDQQGDVGDGRYTTLQAFWFVILNLPKQAYDFMPIGALIGSLLGLGSLARGSEITVMRATGISPARIALTAATAGLLLILLEIVLGEFLAPPLHNAARQQKAFSRFQDVSFGGGGSAWVRDGDLILNVAPQSGAGQFGGMQVFELSADYRLRAIGQAARATTSADQTWLLRDYAESRFMGDDHVLARSSGERRLESAVSAGFLGLAVARPDDLGLATLAQLIRYYEANNLDTRPFLFAFWSRIARTIAIIFAVILAVPFVLGSLRDAGSGARMLVGLILGLGFFLLQRLIESGTFALGLNPVLLAWLPTALLAAVSLGLLARAR